MQKLETQRIQWFIENHEKTRNTKNPNVFRQEDTDQKHKECNGFHTTMEALKTQGIQWFVDNDKNT